jgi:hypothetical protein
MGAAERPMRIRRLQFQRRVQKTHAFPGTHPRPAEQAAIPGGAISGSMRLCSAVQIEINKTHNHTALKLKNPG